MADESPKISQECPEGWFEGLPGAEFELPDISSPLRSIDFVTPKDMFDSVAPTSILDDSFVSEVTNNPSIPLVESVESFAVSGLILNKEEVFPGRSGESSIRQNLPGSKKVKKHHVRRPSEHPGLQISAGGSFPIHQSSHGSSVNFVGGCLCNFCGTCFSTADALQGHLMSGCGTTITAEPS